MVYELPLCQSRMGADGMATSGAQGALPPIAPFRAAHAYRSFINYELIFFDCDLTVETDRLNESIDITCMHGSAVPCWR